MAAGGGVATDSRVVVASLVAHLNNYLKQVNVLSNVEDQDARKTGYRKARMAFSVSSQLNTAPPCPISLGYRRQVTRSLTRHTIADDGGRTMARQRYARKRRCGESGEVQEQFAAAGGRGKPRRVADDFIPSTVECNIHGDRDSHALGPYKHAIAG